MSISATALQKPSTPAPTVRALVPLGKWADWLRFSPMFIGLAALIVPTMKGIAMVAWDTEQGAHGPIVLGIAIWLLIRAWPKIREVAEPSSVLVSAAAFAVLLPTYAVMRIVGSVVLESGALYGILVTTLYLFIGAPAMRRAWFPIAYFLFVLPPPGGLVAAATQPLRLQISQAAVSFLSLFGLSVGRTGLLIYVDQYVLEVKAACGGLNSIISLSAIGLFYAYALHNLNIRYCAILAVVTVFFAIAANFVRVLILILITHFFGDGAAQGFLHGFAGMTMFAVAMLGVMFFDHFAAPLRRTLAGPARTATTGPVS